MLSKGIPSWERSVMEHSKSLGSFLSGKVRVLNGDITAQNVDVIVNAANSTLLGGGGNSQGRNNQLERGRWPEDWQCGCTGCGGRAANTQTGSNSVRARDIVCVTQHLLMRLLSSATLRRPAPPRYTRRTNRANSDRPCRCASRAPRAPQTRAAWHSPDRLRN